jgi:acetyl esterase/lipase
MKVKAAAIALLVCVSLVQSGEVPDAQWIYKTVDGKNLQMAVFLPDAYESGNLFPAFVFFHGGSWREGEASWHYPDCGYWSRRGMVAVSVDYRLKDRDRVDVPLECIKDAKTAIRFLRMNAGRLKIDPGKIVAAGDSAGGQMAAAAAMISDVNDDCHDLPVSCRPDAVILTNPYFKCQPELSPTNFVVNGLPPFIMFIGDQDSAIPVESLKAFHDHLRFAGNHSELYVGKGGRHGFCNGRNPANPFFYWSLELEDRFLVKHGILSGPSMTAVQAGANVLEKCDYETHQ